MTFQFKIQIKNITHPPVWRKLTLPSHFSFLDFHYAIQIAFGWFNEHLFNFSPQGWGSEEIIEIIDEHSNGFIGMQPRKPMDAEKTELSEIFKSEGQKYTYIYDFGDDWIHSITLEKILLEKTILPYCLAGKGMCPPENCGGPWAYMDIKDIISDKTHPEFEELKEYYLYEDQDVWDPNEFNLKEKQDFLSEFFTKT